MAQSNTVILVLPLITSSRAHHEVAHMQYEFNRIVGAAKQWSTLPSLLIISTTSVMSSEDVCDVLAISTLPADLFSDITIWSLSEDAESIDGVAMPNADTSESFSLHLALHIQQYMLCGLSSRSHERLLALSTILSDTTDSLISGNSSAPDLIERFNKGVEDVIKVKFPYHTCPILLTQIVQGISAATSSPWPSRDLWDKQQTCTRATLLLQSLLVPDIPMSNEGDSDFDQCLQFVQRVVQTSSAEQLREYVSSLALQSSAVPWPLVVQHCIAFRLEKIALELDNTWVVVQDRPQTQKPLSAKRKYSVEPSEDRDRSKLGRFEDLSSVHFDEANQTLNTSSLNATHQSGIPAPAKSALLQMLEDEHALQDAFEQQLIALSQLDDENTLLLNNKGKPQLDQTDTSFERAELAFRHDGVVSIKLVQAQLDSHRAANAATEAMLEAMLL